MSSYISGALTRMREQEDRGASTRGGQPGLNTYIDVVAALVPAEVLTLHAVILSFTTETKDEGGTTVTTITEPDTLFWVFWALVVLSIALYIFGFREGIKDWGGWDVVRALIPPIAFVGWTMLQPASAFDAIAPDLRDAPKTAIALIGAAVLAALARWLAQKADEQDPKPGLAKVAGSTPP